jgi:hypothetical protein
VQRTTLWYASRKSGSSVSPARSGDRLQLAVEVLEHHAQVERRGGLVRRGLERAPVVALGAGEIARLVQQPPRFEVGVGVTRSSASTALR